jgi:hypothetical protein
MAVLRTDPSGNIAMLRAEAAAANAENRAETMKSMIGLLLVQGGLIIGLLRLLPGH